MISFHGCRENIGPFPHIKSCRLLQHYLLRCHRRCREKTAICPQRRSQVSNRRKFDHITPVLRDQLHWFPIRQRIDFKIAVFVYNALHGRGPTYLSRTCNPVREVGARAHLRSAIRDDLTVPQTRTRRFGPRSFRVSGPVVWNSLPEDIRIPELSLERFKSMLKTHLFRQAYA